MFISFAWTSEPFLANSKVVTRRYWKDSHAKKFKKGMIVDVYDKLPFRGGKKIGEIKLTKNPYQLNTMWMTEMDYYLEGLLWMEYNNKTINGQKPRDFFERWKDKQDLVWVVEFEKLGGST